MSYSLRNNRLARRNLHDIRQMRPTSRRAWLRHLEIVTEAWEKRRYHRASNQRTIAEFISSDKMLRPPRRRNIVREAREYTDGQVLRCEPQQRRIDSIFPRRERPRRQGDDSIMSRLNIKPHKPTSATRCE